MRRLCVMTICYLLSISGRVARSARERSSGEKTSAAGPGKSDGDATVRHSCPLGAAGESFVAVAPDHRAGFGDQHISPPDYRPRYLARLDSGLRRAAAANEKRAQMGKHPPSQLLPLRQPGRPPSVGVPLALRPRIAPGLPFRRYVKLFYYSRYYWPFQMSSRSFLGRFLSDR
jgi:hypothetical protein